MGTWTLLLLGGIAEIVKTSVFVMSNSVFSISPWDGSTRYLVPWGVALPQSGNCLRKTYPWWAPSALVSFTLCVNVATAGSRVKL